MRGPIVALVAVDHRGVPRALAGAGGGALCRPGRRQRLHPDRGVLQQDGRGDVRRRLRRAGLCRAAGGRALSLGDGGRDAGRARHGRDHARTADHGDAVRGLPRRLARARADCRRCWRRRWAACSPPGSPSCPASSGSSSARPSSRRCAPTRRCRAALGAITAAVVGVILNLAVWFALHVLFAELRPVQPARRHGRRAGAGLGRTSPPLALAAACCRRCLPLQVRDDPGPAGQLDGRHRLRADAIGDAMTDTRSPTASPPIPRARTTTRRFSSAASASSSMARRRPTSRNIA